VDPVGLYNAVHSLPSKSAPLYAEILIVLEDRCYLQSGDQWGLRVHLDQPTSHLAEADRQRGRQKFWWVLLYDRRIIYTFRHYLSMFAEEEVGILSNDFVP